MGSFSSHRYLAGVGLPGIAKYFAIRTGVEPVDFAKSDFNGRIDSQSMRKT
jgi:hypothetical protein